MKNALGLLLFILFFSGSLIPKVGLEQSFKANELLKHFQDHQKLSPQGISFADFLWLHYAADSKHQRHAIGLSKYDHSFANNHLHRMH